MINNLLRIFITKRAINTMHLERAANVKSFYPIFILFGTAVFLCAICLIYYGGFEESIERNVILGIVAIIFGGVMLILPKCAQHYWENTMCLYYADRIGIRKYRKEDVVRRTGIGWALYTYMGYPFMAISIVVGFIGITSDYGFNWGIEFCKSYIFLSWNNIFGTRAIIFIVLGVILKLVFYFSAKKCFAKYKDTIKVSLF